MKALVARIGFAFLLVALLWPSRAHAQSADANTSPAGTTDGSLAGRAKERKELADAALLDGRPTDAINLYTEAYRESRHPSILYNRGRAYMAMGRWLDALADLEEFNRVAPPALRARVFDLSEDLARARGKIARLKITTTVPGVEIRVQGVVRGATPMPEISLEAGRVVIEATKAGYARAVRELELPGGGTSAIELRLDPLPTSARITVQSQLPTVSVFLNEEERGMAPIDLVVVPGHHLLRVKKENHDDTTQGIDVVAGESRTLTITPKSRGSILTRWWFWTAIGVVAAGATVSAIALTTERAPDQGTTTPGQFSTFWTF